MVTPLPSHDSSSVLFQLLCPNIQPFLNTDHSQPAMVSSLSRLPPIFEDTLNSKITVGFQIDHGLFWLIWLLGSSLVWWVHVLDMGLHSLFVYGVYYAGLLYLCFLGAKGGLGLTMTCADSWQSHDGSCSLRLVQATPISRYWDFWLRHRQVQNFLCLLYIITHLWLS